MKLKFTKMLFLTLYMLLMTQIMTKVYSQIIIEKECNTEKHLLEPENFLLDKYLLLAFAVIAFFLCALHLFDLVRSLIKPKND